MMDDMICINTGNTVGCLDQLKKKSLINFRKSQKTWTNKKSTNDYKTCVRFVGTVCTVYLPEEDLYQSLALGKQELLRRLAGVRHSEISLH